MDEWKGTAYYYSNGSGSKRAVALGGSIFEEWMICSQPETMLAALQTFMESGERLDTVLWVSEE